MKPAAKRAGVPWATLHTFRHTCATMLFRHGLNAKQVQAWLGHHSPAFTLSTYVHLLADDLPDPAFLDDLTRGNRWATEPAENDRNDAAGLDAPPGMNPSEPRSAEVQAVSS